MIESVAALATICVVSLLILANLAQTSHTETNIEPATSLKYTSPKYTPVARAVVSGMMPRASMSRDQMENVRRELEKRRRWLAHVCETINMKRSQLDTTLTNMIIDT